MKHFTDAEIEKLVTVGDAVDAMDAAFRLFGRKQAAVQPRARTELGEVKLSTLGAIVAEENVAAVKVYTTVGGRFHFVILLFSTVDGRPLATMEANAFTRLRTAAVTVVAARALANPRPRAVAVFGSGVQARGHVAAFAHAYPGAELRLVSRGDAGALASTLGRELNRTVRAMPGAAALADSDVVVTATRATTPLFSGRDVAPGCFVAAVGSSRPDARELDDDLLRRARRIVVEWKVQTKQEAGDLLLAAPGIVDWEAVADLGDILTGSAPGRERPEDIIVFKSVGIGLEDAMLASRVYNKACS